MNVFISWSGIVSRSVASILKACLTRSFPDTTVWMSDVDIPIGANWSYSVSRALEDADFGIICVSAENLNSPWLLFEAGAISKSIEGTRVVPYLIGLRHRDIQGPLAQFQCARANHEGTRKLFAELGKVDSRNASVWENAFDASWLRIVNALFWREYDFGGKRVHRTVREVPNGDTRIEAVAGWSFAIAPGAYICNFSFADVLWENELIIYARHASEESDPTENEWARLLSCRSHSDRRMHELSLADPTHMFVAGYHKEGPTNPFLPWQTSDALDAVFDEGTLAVSFDDDAGGRCQLAIRPKDSKAIDWFVAWRYL